ncbi:MAG: CapA family protein [Treponema sp.]|nr:CapA family protein [Treponema sp.]
MKSFSFRRYIVSFLTLFFVACGSTKVVPSVDTESPPSEQESHITLLFAGDIMAHNVNYNFGHFDAIWNDIAPIVSAADVAFANVEAPVDDNLPWSTFPQFNMHGSYIDAAINAGFDVFSLANNHTNDQSLNGMRGTLKYFKSKKNIHACGIKEKPNTPLTYQIIEKNDWKILFVAFTELLNSQDSAGYIDYIPSKGKKHDTILADLKKLRDEHPCDVFVVSVHADEPEYIRKVHDYQKQFYHALIQEAHADIVWSNHAHIVKEWEMIPETTQSDGSISRGGLIMYANGNTISGQRTSPQFKKPDTERDYTGDGLMMHVTLSKKTDADGNSAIFFNELTPHFITTYITPAWQFVVRLMDDDLPRSLRRAGLSTWANYLTERKKIMEKIQEKSTWQ